MKKGVFFINNVCGKVVDFFVFCDVFEFDYFVGVVIDVFFKEFGFNGFGFNEIFGDFIFWFWKIFNFIFIFYIGGFIEEV